NVSEILGSVRHVSRPGPSRLQPEDLNESIRATVRITTCAWKEVAEIRLRLGTLPRVECDLGELHQVLLNLLVNSARAIGEKSSCYPSRSGFIDVETSQVGEEVEILVSDNGCGIPEGQLPRVFDPFVSGGTFKESSGQGLRMAQAAICDHHGGSLSVESTVGEGTTVRIRLPVRSRRGVGGGSLGGPSASLQSTMGSTSSSV
ncbi:MAG: hypothetical protein KDD47_24110, partial [Acidobacteria bacterium]|nr:hypothetical protein [Acidobacteriota bacterium]